LRFLPARNPMTSCDKRHVIRYLSRVTADGLQELFVKKPFLEKSFNPEVILFMILAVDLWIESEPANGL